MTEVRLPGIPGIGIPGSWSVRSVAPPEAPPADLEAELDRIRGRISSRLRRRGARQGARVTIAVPDLTRTCPLPRLLDHMVEELADAGVAHDNVLVLLALGMHRPLGADEMRSLLGPWRDRLRVLQSDGSIPGGFSDLGSVIEPETGTMVPVFLHRALVEADLRLAIGVVEPHQYAGYSGGAKTAAVGCAGEATISALHGLGFLEHPRTALGRLAGNPFQAAVRAVAGRAPLDAVLNVARGPGGGYLAAGGSPEVVGRELADRIAPGLWVEEEAPVDVVFAGVPSAKASSLYQASRALTYLEFTGRPVVRDGGWVVLGAACEEGWGRGAGEARFETALRGTASPAEVVRSLRERGTGAGEQRAFLVARTLERVRAMIVGAEGAVLPGSPLRTPRNAGEAAELLRHELGNGPVRALVVPDALRTLVRLRGPVTG